MQKIIEAIKYRLGYLGFLIYPLIVCLGISWASWFLGIIGSLFWPLGIIIAIAFLVYGIFICHLFMTEIYSTKDRLFDYFIFAPWVFAATWLVIMAAALLTHVAVNKFGIDVSISAHGSKKELSSFVYLYFWILIDLLPIFEIPETLRLTRPLTWDNAAIGSIVLAYKIYLVFGVFAVVRICIKLWKQGNASAAAQLDTDTTKNLKGDS